MDELKFNELAQRHPGVSEGIAQAYDEAARVCLGRHHEPPQTFVIKGDSKQLECIADWDTATSREKRAWNNTIDATEWGACGVALAAIELMFGLVAVARAETGTGADYLLDTPGKPFDNIEECLRLEISGMDRANASDLNDRVRRKINQTRRGKASQPARTAVVVFQSLIVAMSEVR